MMRAVPRMASVRQATIKSQTVMSVKHKASISVMTWTDQSMTSFIISLISLHSKNYITESELTLETRISFSEDKAGKDCWPALLCFVP